MDASRKPSIATEVHASHERPHRLALLATSPVATGEAKQEEPRKGTETIKHICFSLRDTRFQNHIPARGRKLLIAICKNLSASNFKTISPQGDGNALAILDAALKDDFKTISP